MYPMLSPILLAEHTLQALLRYGHERVNVTVKSRNRQHTTNTHTHTYGKEENQLDATITIY